MICDSVLAFVGILLQSEGWFMSLINVFANIMYMSEPFGGFPGLVSTDEDCGIDGRDSNWEIDGNDFIKAEQYISYRLR